MISHEIKIEQEYEHKIEYRAGLKWKLNHFRIVTMCSHQSCPIFHDTGPWAVNILMALASTEGEPIIS
ncbi:hypothetical protein VNO77_42073 [Canavalia gladiata]|uniref:Uncharacterized protein n=1 Tax=Canavalia gladiata TaxID=3824 RepID=A0AAN9K2M0_CANGL